MKEFKIPTVNYPELESVQDAIELLNKEEDLKYNRVLEAIEEGYKNDLKFVDLFKLKIINPHTYIMRCHKHEWETCLLECLKYFEKNENFEKCAKIKKIKEKYN